MDALLLGGVFAMACLYLLSLLYTSITGKKSNQFLSLSEINSSITSKGGGWAIFLPLVSILVLLYNVLVNSFWFLGVIFDFFAFLLKWIWNEVVIAGALFLFRIVWHYFVKWPWKILLLAFTKILPALKLSFIKIGAFSLFLSLSINFLGKYTVQIFNWWEGLNLVFGILAVIPIGIGISKIIDRISLTSEDENNFSSKYFRHLIYIIGAFLILLFIECIILYLGTFTLYASSLSAIIVGGNLFGSLLIMFNAILLLYALTALPSFSREYEGENKDIIKSFLNYLKFSWAKYLIALPAMILPAILVAIFPYLITQGISNIGGSISDAVYDFRITEMNKNINKNPTYDYAKWLDPADISDDELKQQQMDDIKRAKSNVALNNAILDKKYFNQFYSIHSSEVGATPVLALHYLFEKFDKAEKDLLKTTPPDALSLSDPLAEKWQIKIQKEIIPQKTDEIKKIDDRLSQLNKYLASICDTSRRNTVSGATNDNQKTAQPSSERPVSEQDYCTIQREETRKQIKIAKEDKALSEKNLERAKLVSDHLAVINSIQVNGLSANSLSAKFAYLVVTIWLCLLFGFAFGTVVPLVAMVNHALYSESDTGDLFIISSIKTANQLNSNQPLLGILLFPFLLPILFSIVIMFTSLFKSFYDPSGNFLDRIKNSIISSIGLNEFDKILLDISGSDEPVIVDTVSNSMSLDSIPAVFEDSSEVIAVDTVMAVPMVYEQQDVDIAPVLNTNFNYNKGIHLANGAPEKSYTVLVDCVIDDTGNLTDIIPQTSFGFGMEDEIITKLKSTSGQWIPGSKQGQKVTVRMSYSFPFGDN